MYIHIYFLQNQRWLLCLLKVLHKYIRTTRGIHTLGTHLLEETENTVGTMSKPYQEAGRCLLSESKGERGALPVGSSNPMENEIQRKIRIYSRLIDLQRKQDLKETLLDQEGSSTSQGNEVKNGSSATFNSEDCILISPELINQSVVEKGVMQIPNSNIYLEFKLVPNSSNSCTTTATTTTTTTTVKKMRIKTRSKSPKRRTIHISTVRSIMQTSTGKNSISISINSGGASPAPQEIVSLESSARSQQQKQSSSAGGTYLLVKKCPLTLVNENGSPPPLAQDLNTTSALVIQDQATTKDALTPFITEEQKILFPSTVTSAECGDKAPNVIEADTAVRNELSDSVFLKPKNGVSLVKTHRARSKSPKARSFQSPRSQDQRMTTFNLSQKTVAEAVRSFSSEDSLLFPTPIYYPPQRMSLPGPDAVMQKSSVRCPEFPSMAPQPPSELQVAKPMVEVSGPSAPGDICELLYEVTDYVMDGVDYVGTAEDNIMAAGDNNGGIEQVVPNTGYGERCSFRSQIFEQK